MLNPESNRGQRIDHSYVMPKRRWYDYRPILFHALDLMTSVPTDVCDVVANEINGFAEQEYEADAITHADGPKSLGKDKVLALYKSKNRQRQLDQSDALHILLNYLFILPEKQQYALATQILGVSAVVYDYVSACRVFDCSPDTADIRRLSDLYFDTGMDSAKGALEVIKAELRIGSTGLAPKVDEWLHEVDAADGAEMKLEGRTETDL